MSFASLLKILRSISLIIFLLMSLSIVYGQSAGGTSAALTGKVSDEQNAVIGGATITARNLQTNYMREVTTEEDGTFQIAQLPPGPYEIIARADGFSMKTSKLELVLGTTALFNLTLTIGNPTDVIEVVSGNIIDEGKTESSTNITTASIDSLPINRRNFLDFSLTAARVLNDRVPSQGASATSGLSFNGLTARFNNITIDGLDNNDLGSGSVRSTYSQDAVQEFQIISDNYAAEFGRALGGIVNIVTRSGSNDYHGRLFFFNRNDALNARDAFASVKPEFKQYQFGATLNGPIKKDHTFFFTSFERLSVKQSNIITIGDATVNAARNLGFTLNNGPVPFSVNNSAFLARIDTKLSSNDTIWFRYNFAGSYNGALEPFGGLIGETNAGIQRLTDHAGAISNTYIAPALNLVNETRFLFTKRDQNVSQVNDDTQVRLNAPEGQVTFGRGTFLPQPRALDIYQILDTVSLSRGHNQIKFGVDYRAFNTVNRETQLPLFPGGLATFSTLNFSQFTGMAGLPTLTTLQAFDPSLRTPDQIAFLNVLSALLPARFAGFPAGVPLATLPLPLFYGQGFGDPSLQSNGKELALYAQDDIKVRPNFLIKVGLRYDLTRIKFVPKRNGNFAPRIAFTYNPKAIPNLNIRGAYGLFFGGALVGQTFIINLLQTKTLQAPIQPFPFSILPFAQPGRHFPPSTTIPASLKVTPQFNQDFVIDPNLRNSYSQQLSFGVDYLLGPNNILSFNYVNVRGLRLFAPRNINPVVRPLMDPIQSVITGRIDPTRGEISNFESSFDSYYNAFTVAFNRRFNKNIGILAHYTFSKAIDDYIDIRPDLQEVNDALNIGNERGLSLQDVRSRFVLSGTWDLNYTKNKFLNGFQVSAILSLNSGRPYNLIAGTDLNASGDTLPGDRPRVGGVSIGRNVGITPGFANMDLRITRTVSFAEHYSVQGFFEVFNLFNRVNINDIDRIFPPDAMGNFHLPPKEDGRFTAPPERFRSAFAPRQIQLGFRLSF